MIENNNSEAEANIDISNDEKLSLQETVSKFCVLKASDLLAMKSFRRQQELNFEWMKPSDCHLLIFISHRWETLEHPDPSGKQISALKTLINLICDAAAALSAETVEERLHYLPSLRLHGAIQAAILLSRLSTSGSASELDENEKPVHEWLPEHIGIWYDFACLPQSPRSKEQEVEFKSALLELPNLLQSQEMSLVALREEGDDYELRGWCFAEARLASTNISFAPVALSLDRMETTFDYQLLNKNKDFDSQINDDPGVQFEAALASWENPEIYNISSDDCWKIIVFQSCITPDSLPMAKVDSPMLGTSKFANPANTWIGLMVADLAAQGDQIFDFSSVVLSILKEKKLYCSEDKDLVYVGLLALLWSCSKKSRLRKFLQQCLERCVKMESLLMTINFNEPFQSSDQNSSGSINSDNLNWIFC